MNLESSPTKKLSRLILFGLGLFSFVLGSGGGFWVRDILVSRFNKQQSTIRQEVHDRENKEKPEISLRPLDVNSIWRMDLLEVLNTGIKDPGSSSVRLQIEVLSKEYKPISQVQVTAVKGWQEKWGSDFQAIGELGIVKGPLPYPTDVISGSAVGLTAELFSGEIVASAMTNEQGVAIFSDLPEGLIGLIAHHGEFSSKSFVRITHSMEENQNQTIHLVLLLEPPFKQDWPSAGICPAEGNVVVEPTEEDPSLPEQQTPQQTQRISGKFYDERTGNIISDVSAEWIYQGKKHPFFVEKTGSFSVEGIPVGKITIQAKAPSCVTFRQEIKVEADRPFIDLQFALKKGGSLRGNVRGDLKKEVWVKLKNQEGHLIAKVKTDLQGNFLLQNLPQGDFLVEVEKSIQSIKIYPEYEQFLEIILP